MNSKAKYGGSIGVGGEGAGVIKNGRLTLGLGRLTLGLGLHIIIMLGGL